MHFIPSGIAPFHSLCILSDLQPPPTQFLFYSLQLVTRTAERGGRRGHCPGTQGDPGFWIVRFRMQNSSAQTTACGRDDVIFWFRAEIRTSADAMTLCCSSLDVEPKFEHLRRLWPFFCSSLDFRPKFEHLRDAMTFFLLIMCFWGTTDQRAQTNFLPRGPKVLSAPLLVTPMSALVFLTFAAHSLQASMPSLECYHHPSKPRIRTTLLHSLLSFYITFPWNPAIISLIIPGLIFA